METTFTVQRVDGRGVIVASLLIGGILGVVAGIAQSVDAERESAAPLTATPSSDTATVAPLTILDGLGEHMISIRYSDDPAVNCGGPTGGCFHPQQPDTLIISPTAEGETLRYIVLHEYAHVLQYRAGAPLDECAADRQAVAWGARMTHYLPTCPEPKE